MSFGPENRAAYGDPRVLPPDLRGVYDRIPAYIPERFKRAAVEAGQYIQALDSSPTFPTQEPNLGGSQTPDISRFVSQIARSKFINRVKTDFALPMFGEKSPDPAVALPHWLQYSYLVASDPRLCSFKH